MIKSGLRAVLAALCFFGSVLAHAQSPTPVADGAQWMGTNQYLLEGRCLVSANKKWFACAEPGNLRVRYYVRSGGEVHFDTAIPCCQAGYKKIFVIMEDSGNIALWDGPDPAHRSGVWWHANANAPGGRFFLIMQDDGNLCRYAGTGPSQRDASVQGWCTRTGRTYVEAMLKNSPPTDFNRDLPAAMAMFDAGARIATMPKYTEITVPGGQCMMAQGGLWGKCVQRQSSCWEVTNISGKPVILQSRWDNDPTPRQWALLKAGQSMRFDNRGERDHIWCVGDCGGRTYAYTSGAQGTRWDWWNLVQIWRKWTNDNFPSDGSCKDNLGLGQTH